MEENQHLFSFVVRPYLKIFNPRKQMQASLLGIWLFLSATRQYSEDPM